MNSAIGPRINPTITGAREIQAAGRPSNRIRRSAIATRSLTP